MSFFLFLKTEVFLKTEASSRLEFSSRLSRLVISWRLHAFESAAWIFPPPRVFGGFPGSLTSNILPEIFTRVEHEDWGRTRLSWEDCQEASTWCLLQLLRWFSIRTEAIVKLDEWLYQDLYNPPSSALGEQLWRNKGILARVYWQSLANFCRCRIALGHYQPLNPIWPTSWLVKNT